MDDQKKRMWFKRLHLRSAAKMASATPLADAGFYELRDGQPGGFCTPMSWAHTCPVMRRPSTTTCSPQAFAAFSNLPPTLDDPIFKEERKVFDSINRPLFLIAETSNTPAVKDAALLVGIDLFLHAHECSCAMAYRANNLARSPELQDSPASDQMCGRNQNYTAQIPLLQS